MRLVVFSLLLAVCAGACAKGFPLTSSEELPLSGLAGAPALPGLPTPDGGMADPMDLGDAGPVEPEGDPCTQGAMEACVCEDKGTEGMRRCMFDADSPLDGFFSECEGCPDPPPPEPMMPEPTGGTAGGTGGTGGMTAGSGGTAGGAAGTGGMTAGGTGCLANAAMCTALLQCCRMDGTCGVGLPGVLCL